METKHSLSRTKDYLQPWTIPSCYFLPWYRKWFTSAWTEGAASVLKQNIVHIWVGGRKRDHIYYTVRDCEFLFFTRRCRRFLWRVGALSIRQAGQDMQEGWWERVGGRGMFREKPRQLTDVGSTAEPPLLQPFPPPPPCHKKKGWKKKCPQQQAYRHARFKVWTAYVRDQRNCQ